MSISSEITRISGNVSSALTAISNKGVTVPSGSNSDDLATLIGQISGGGGTTWETVYQGSAACVAYEDGYYYYLYNPFNELISLNDVWRVTWNGTPYECTSTVDGTPYNLDDYIIGNPGIIGATPSVANEPFILGRIFTDRLLIATLQSGTYSVKLEKQVSSGTSWETVYTGNVNTNADWGNGNYYTMIYPWSDGIALDSVWRVTWDGTTYECTATWEGSQDGNPYAIGNYTYDGGSGGTDKPFFMQLYYGTQLAVVSAVYGSHTVMIEKQVSGGATLITKTITANGTYDAEDDDADGYSEVTVAIPTGTAGTPTATKGTVSNHSISVTPSVTNTAGVISGGTINGTAVTVSASELVSGSETKTANGTYDVTNLASLVVNVSGGSGLVYETGTYTPSSNTAQPTISFSGSHSTPPVFIAMSDTSSASGITSNSNTSWCIVDYWRINGAGFPNSTSATRYAVVYYGYRGSNNTTISSIQTQYNSDNTGTDNTSYYRYWATASNFKPSSNSTSRYWRSGRTYKWIAVWK